MKLKIGSGIPEELSEHIFEPFISTKSGGSGLGLAMVASVIADHGAQLPSAQAPYVFQINLPFLNLRDQQGFAESLREIDALFR